MDIAVEDRKGTGYTVLTVGGEVDVYTASALQNSIAQVLESGRHHVAIDLDAVEFMDSTGLGVLVAGLDRARAAGGAEWLVCSQQRLLKLFQITGLTDVFTFYDTVDDLLAAHPRL